MGIAHLRQKKKKKESVLRTANLRQIYLRKHIFIDFM